MEGTASQSLVLGITVADGPQVSFLLRGALVSMGRSPFNDLTFLDESISLNHCQLRRDSSGWKLRDASGGHTSVNGKPVSSHLLSMGDVIEFGDVRLILNALDKSNSLDSVGEQTALLPGKNKLKSGRLQWVGKEGRQVHGIKSSVWIGTDPVCQIHIEDEFTSRRHCMLEPTQSGVLLRDLNSTNGTWIKDLRVIEAILPACCDFRVGNTTISFDGAAAGEKVEQVETFFGMVGEHPSLLRAQSLIRRIASREETVLLHGETGTGKELAARAIHELSDRRGRPFIAVNCAALAGELIESELFGHVKGAFTGAGAARRGAFESAQDGTLFLDEIGELPLSLQAKLLRALDSGEIKPVGSDVCANHKARVVVATNRDLMEMEQQGSFRQDLYYRLSSLPVNLPPLRERREDILLLVEHFLAESGVSPRFTRQAKDALLYYYWPGNIRELKNVITATLCYHADAVERGVLDEEHLIMHGPGALVPHSTKSVESIEGYGGETLEDAEAQLIKHAIKYFGGNKSQASRALGISKSTLYSKIRRYGIEQ